MTRVLLPLALTASLAAGCGSSSSSGGGSKPTPVANGAIEMKDIAFSPRDASVKVGQKVTWTNEDAVAHNVVADDGSFKSGDFGQNGTYSFTPKKAGTYTYSCTLHPGMTATLTVTG
jgi:plastocyanin